MREKERTGEKTMSGGSSVDVEAIVRSVLPVDWYASTVYDERPLPDQYRLAVHGSIRAAVNATLAALPPTEGEVDGEGVEYWHRHYRLAEESVTKWSQRTLAAEAEVSQLRARLSALEDIDKVADYNIAMVGTLQEGNEQLKARVAELEATIAAGLHLEGAIDAIADMPHDLEAEDRIASLESQLAASQAALRWIADWADPATAVAAKARAALQALPERPAGGE